jgi:hypothetical protein
VGKSRPLIVPQRRGSTRFAHASPSPPNAWAKSLLVFRACDEIIVRDFAHPTAAGYETTMRRADRLFDIIQILRTSSRPVTAAALAEQLEVTVRTVYRDVATLQARVPIDGAPGIGYLLRRGFDLPPLMFTTEEIDAIALGARLVRRIRDPKLQRAADSVLAKVTTVVPAPLRPQLASPALYISEGSAQTPTGIDLSATRFATPARCISPTWTRRAGARRAPSGRSRWRTTWT